MKKIEGTPKSLKQLLQNTKYSIHYYQREYMWQKKQIEELIDDLTSEFLDSFVEGDARNKVSEYGTYFMGSIVLAGRENAIIDGQQRLSSLTLLLIYLNNRLKKLGQEYRLIDQMIYSESYGTCSFNINVESRQKVMEAIYQDKEYDDLSTDESVKNLYGRYIDIVDLFESVPISNNNLLHFCDWLAEKVFFIEIVATTEQDAHKVFVTMNDRGLSLTSTEMLKGYLLSEIMDDKKREDLNNLWKDKVLLLKKFDEKGDETFIKSWLRAQYAETIRETKAGAVNKDFDLIGGSFHKWVRDEEDKLGLKCSEDYELFIHKFAKFSEIYLKIKQAETAFNSKFKYIYYNSTLEFTLQSQVLLAPICYDDSEDIINEKLNLVSRFIDIWIMTRVTNYSSVGYSTIKNYIFNLTKDIRRCDITTLKNKLKISFQNLNYDVESSISSFGLNAFTKKYIKNILARITDYIEIETGVNGNYVNYMNTDTKNPFEVEHILTDHFEWFTSEYNDREDFKHYRNSIGSLLLLRKSINASLNDSLYDYKLKSYCSNEGNIFTESLGEQAYKNNPRFTSFVKNNNLDFKPYSHFGKMECLERTKLVTELVKLVWNTKMFD